MLLTSTRWRSGMLLNVQDQPPRAENYPAYNDNSAKVEKPCLGRRSGQLSCPLQLANKPLGAVSSLLTGHGLYHQTSTLDTATWIRVCRHLSQGQSTKTNEFPLRQTGENRGYGDFLDQTISQQFALEVKWRDRATDGRYEKC